MELAWTIPLKRAEIDGFEKQVSESDSEGMNERTIKHVVKSETEGIDVVSE